MQMQPGWMVVVLLVACGDDGVTRLPDAPVPIDAAIDAPRVCIAPTGAGTMHGSNLAAAETWTEAASPHILASDTTVSATITIEPCAVVRIEGGRTITVAAGGTISANGLPGLPVTIERLTATTAYGPIRAIAGSLSLTHTIVRGGGNPLGPVSLGAAILMQRSPATTTGTLHVDALEIDNSASSGIALVGIGGFDASSQGLVIHNSVAHPIRIDPGLVGSIPTGTFTGNGVDAILISTTGGQVTTSQTLRDRGVPYRVGTMANDQLDVVAPTGVATLTIEPGVRLEFQAGGRLRIDTNGGSTAPSKGALVAVGTAARPIVFTSAAATPAAGDWLGIWFAGATDPASRIQHARVEFAGGATVTGSNSCPYPGRVGENYAAIRIFGTTAPGTQYITDTTILSSARDGIDRGWRDDPQPDFLPTNTFTNVVGCKQSVPRTLAGVCPATPPCP